MKGLLRLIVLGGLLMILGLCAVGLVVGPTQRAARQAVEQSSRDSSDPQSGGTESTEPPASPETAPPGANSASSQTRSRSQEIPASLDREILAQLKVIAGQSDRIRKKRVAELRLRARYFRTSNQTRKAREVSAAAERMEKSRALFFDSIRAPYQVGEIGFLQDDVVQVISIVGSSDFVGMISYGDFDTQIVWLSGWNTDSVLTGAKMRIDDLIRVTGTQDYTTVLGANNRVVVIEPFDSRPYLPYVMPEAEPEVVKPEPTEEELREKELRAAQAKLRLARQLLERDKTAKAKEWLQELVREFPDTAAADEARQMLSDMETE